jgi:FkbM family methyltransferase
MPLNRDTVAWAYRILLDREPESEDVLLPKMRAYDSTRQLRHDIVTSDEYQEKNRDFAHANDRTLVVKEISEGLRLWVDLADHAIGLNIVRGRYELNELEFIRRTLRPGQHAVDCGAHVGFFAMHMAARVGPTGSVTAFEPFGANAECLERSIAENRFQDRVRLVRAAAGQAGGALPLVYAPNTINSGGAFLQTSGPPPPGHNTVEVPVVALDAADLPRPVAFIKADIEGAEPLAFRGADRLLREDRPVVLSELHPWQLGRVAGVTAAEFIAEMAGRGYRCHLLGAGVIGAEIHDAPSNGVTSVVFVPVSANHPSTSSGWP